MEFLAWARENNDQDMTDALILIQNRYHQVRRQENLGIIQFSDALQQQAIISNSILDFLNKVEAPAPIAVLPNNGKPEAPQQKVILFLASNPLPEAKLQLEKEYVRIAATLQEKVDKYRLVAEWAVTPQKLLAALLKYRPNFVHFSGHGLSEAEAGKRGTRPSGLPAEAEEDIGGIFLEDPQGKPKFVNGQALTRLFETVSKKIELEVVLLNACHSEEQARTIAQFVPYVIGMSDAVYDNTAIEFSSGFYQTMASENDIDFAFDIARTMIQMEGLPDDKVPVIYKK